MRASPRRTRAAPASAAAPDGLSLPGAGGPAAAAGAAGEQEDDPDLDQYNAYLDRLSRQDQDEAAGRGPRPH